MCPPHYWVAYPASPPLPNDLVSTSYEVLYVFVTSPRAASTLRGSKWTLRPVMRCTRYRPCGLSDCQGNLPQRSCCPPSRRPCMALNATLQSPQTLPHHPHAVTTEHNPVPHSSTNQLLQCTEVFQTCINNHNTLLNRSITYLIHTIFCCGRSLIIPKSYTVMAEFAQGTM